MVNTIWISFLISLIIFFTLYSIFSKKSEIEGDAGSIYDNFTKRSNKRRYSRIKSVKKETIKEDPKPINPIKKVTPKRKPKKVKTLKKENKELERDRLKTNHKPNIKQTPKPKKKEIPKKEIPIPKIIESTKKETPPKEKLVKEPKEIITNTIKTNGLEFKGDFDEKEISFLKKYSSKNRGFVTQKVNDKMVLNRWVKTKRSYSMLMDEIKKKEDSKGIYYTYVIWDSKVDKYLLKSKIK